MKKNWFIRLLFILILFVSIVFLTIGVYASTSYRATDEAYKYLESDNSTDVEDCGEYITISPKENIKSGIIFYPGALVDVESYAPLFKMLALNGYKTYMVRMPYQIAFFNAKICDKIKNNNNDLDFYLVGHSLGGATLSMVDTANYKGICLLASYITKEVNTKVLLLRGSNDTVLNYDTYEASKKNYSTYTERIIDGGNHAGFAMYGNQRKDSEATISNITQIEEAQKYMMEFMQ